VPPIITHEKLLKTCGCSVNNLCIKRHEDYFEATSAGDSSSSATVDEPSRLPSLDRAALPRKNARSSTSLLDNLVPNPVHRFDESIAGHPYSIEVALVSRDRWRANIVRLPGLPTALMPFYGRTPDEAARHLTDWLSRAHRRAASPAAG
jgi:hypothetical protein